LENEEHQLFPPKYHDEDSFFLTLSMNHQS
jgi:hypothetical protein